MKNMTKVVIKDSAGLPVQFKTGVVVGKITVPMPYIGIVYAIDVGAPISEEYPYQVVGISEIHLDEY